MKLQNVIDVLGELYPGYLRVDKDPVGLQVGSRTQTVTKILVSLDVNMDVVREAIALGADCIVSYHALLYAGIHSVDFEDHKGAIVAELIRHGIAVYSLHSRLDTASDGLGQWLADSIGLQNTRVFLPTFTRTIKKLSVLVPQNHVVAVRDALFAAGLGVQGNYSHCSFVVHGGGTFMAEAGSHAFVGEIGELYLEEGARLDVLLNDEQVDAAKAVLNEVHPYEEVTYEIVDTGMVSAQFGFGRIGEFAEAMSVPEVVALAKQVFGLEHVHFIGDNMAQVKRVAIVGGSGDEFYPEAIAAGVDLYMTGDILFHTAQDAKNSGLNMLDIGHYAEHIVSERLQQILSAAVGIPVVATTVKTNPFTDL